MPTSIIPVNKISVKTFTLEEKAKTKKILSQFINLKYGSSTSRAVFDYMDHYIEVMDTPAWKKEYEAMPSFFTYYFPKDKRARNFLSSGLESPICEIDDKGYSNSVYIAFIDREGKMHNNPELYDLAEVLSLGALPSYLDYGDSSNFFWISDEACVPGQGKVRDLIQMLASLGFEYSPLPNNCFLEQYIQIDNDKQMLEIGLEKPYISNINKNKI